MQKLTKCAIKYTYNVPKIQHRQKSFVAKNPAKIPQKSFLTNQKSFMHKNLLEPKQKAYNIISMFNKEIIYRYRKISLTNYDWYEIDPDCKFIPIKFTEKILNEQKTFDNIKYWQKVLEEIYSL